MYKKLLLVILILTLLPLNSYANEVEGDPIIIAVIDTGVDINHDFLKPHLIEGFNVITKDYKVDDKNGHGTNVTGVIVNTIKDYNVKIMPIKIRSDESDSYTANSIIEGIDYAVEHGADIVNLSLSGEVYSIELKFKIMDYYNEQGIIFVASAGNSGENEYLYPASHYEVISVGATYQKNIAYFSTNNNFVDFVAEGMYIRTTSTNNRYEVLSGTSFSAPYVSSVIAIMKSINPSLSPKQIEEILIETANDLGAHGKDNYYGHGFVDIENAINRVKSSK